MKSLMGHSLAWPADYNWYPVTEISNFPRQHVTNASLFFPWFLSMWSMATASTTPSTSLMLAATHTAENSDTTPRRLQTIANPTKWIPDIEEAPPPRKRRPAASSFASTFEEVIQWKQIDIEFPTKKARDAAIKSGRFVAENNLPLGLQVFRSKIFVTLPKWKEGVPITLGFVRRGEGRSPAIKPYPDWSWHSQSCDGLTSVFRIDVDVCNRLWVLDSGVVDAENTVRQMCPPQIFIFDLETDKLLHRYAIPRDQSPDSSLLSNIVVEVLQNNHNNAANGSSSGRRQHRDTDSHSHGHSHSHTRSHTRSYRDSDSYTTNFNHSPRAKHHQHQYQHHHSRNRDNGYDCVDAYAYLGDVFRYGLIVYSYKTNRSWRVTHSYFYPDPLASDYILDGIEFQWVDGLFGMAISPADPKGQRLLYFHPLSSYREFSVPTHILRNETLGFAMTKFFRIVGKPRGEAVSHSTGSGISNNGILFYNLLTKAAVACWNSNLPDYNPSTQHVLYQDNVTMSFPNDLRVDLEPQQSVWVLSNRLHRFLYDRLDPNDINFRILSAPVDGVVRGTVCDPNALHVGHYNDEPSTRYYDPW